MSGEDGFLTRWSRRKRAVREETVTAPPVITEDGPPAPPAAESEPPDLAALPPLESLGPDSTLAPFLQKGIPEGLRNAAMRQIWEADPAIRDYIGPADYQWDFHTPGALVGFGDLETGTDVARMVADVTEYHLKTPPVPEDSAVAQVVPQVPADAVEAEAEDGTTDPTPALAALPEIEGGSGAAASEVEPAQKALTPPRRRRHGGAAPA